MKIRLVAYMVDHQDFATKSGSFKARAFNEIIELALADRVFAKAAENQVHRLKGLRRLWRRRMLKALEKAPGERWAHCGTDDQHRQFAVPSRGVAQPVRRDTAVFEGNRRRRVIRFQFRAERTAIRLYGEITARASLLVWYCRFCTA